MEEIKLLIIAKEKRFIMKIKAILKSATRFRLRGVLWQEDDWAYVSFNDVDICLIEDEAFGDNISSMITSLIEQERHILVVVAMKEFTKMKMKALISAGAHEIVEKPGMQSVLKETLEKLYDREWVRRKMWKKGALEVRSQAKVFSFFAPNGGVGNTTLAVNVAVTLARMGKSVLFMDADFQFGDVSAVLQYTPGITLLELIQESTVIEKFTINEIFSKHSSGLYILPAPLNLEDAERFNEVQMKELLLQFKAYFEYIIIDCPSWLQDRVFTYFDLSDKVFCISTQDIASLRNVKRVLSMLQNLSYEAKKIEVVINKVHRNYGIKIREVQKIFGQKVFATIPSDNLFVTKNLDQGLACVVQNKHHRVSRAIIHLAEGIIENRFMARRVIKPFWKRWMRRKM